MPIYLSRNTGKLKILKNTAHRCYYSLCVIYDTVNIIVQQ